MPKPIYMKRDEIVGVPPYCVDYLVNLQVVRSLSPLTVHEYYLDLRTFFRYLKVGDVSMEVFEKTDALGLSVEYMYAVSFSKSDQAVIIFRFDDQEAAADKLASAGVQLLSADELIG